MFPLTRTAVLLSRDLNGSGLLKMPASERKPAFLFKYNRLDLAFRPIDRHAAQQFWIEIRRFLRQDIACQGNLSYLLYADRIEQKGNLILPAIDPRNGRFHFPFVSDVRFAATASGVIPIPFSRISR